MADSASDPKVEDVLSSVRRLVSGEIPRKERAPLPKGPGALVLTDAHRVQKNPMVRPLSRSLEERIAELEAAVDHGNQEFEPDGSEDQAQNVPDRIVYTRPPKSEEDAKMRGSALRLTEISLIPTGPANDADDTDETVATPSFRHGPKSTPISSEGDDQPVPNQQMGDNGGPALDPSPEDEAPMAEDVPVQPRQRADVTVFSNPDEVLERIEARFDRGGEDIAPVAPIGEASEPDAFDAPSEATENMLRQDVHEGDTDPDSSFDAALSQAVEASLTSAVFAELAETVDTKPDDVIAQSEQAEVFDPQAMALPDSATDDVSDAEDVSETEVASASEETALAADPLDYIEEPIDAPQPATPPLPEADEMRDLVARLIREELQGELGERITRNVRKLVRREVKRALDARDLI